MNKRLKHWSFYAICIHDADGAEGFYTGHGSEMIRVDQYPVRKFATEDEAKNVVHQLVKGGVYEKSEIGVSRIEIGFHWYDHE